MDRIAVRAMIRGRVQGVGYRWWAVRTAAGLGLDGWVRNRTDGSVELVAAGPADKLEALLAACRDGPASARVDEIERFAALDEGWSGFEARPTL
jgi:acylphosphatase